MTKLSYEELLNYLTEILNCEAFELHIESLNNELQNFYIPYMMNDALECYLLLENGRMTGTYLADSKDLLSVELIETEKNPGLLFRQGKDNIFTLWFENCYRVLNLYRYDQIGHFWVKGQEQWRQLVYIIGTIYDKYEYMGNAVCNAEEMALLSLMEFAPFRWYSPIHESLDEFYPESKNGTLLMRELAKEADDKCFSFWLKIYEKFPLKGITRILVWLMTRPKRQPLYELIYNKMQDASMKYPERSCGEDLNKRIARERLDVAEHLYAQGFEGEYPRFKKHVSDHKSTIQVLATEEHPFTILESETFDFKIQLMVSESQQQQASFSAAGKRKSSGLNAGFFYGKRNKSSIHHIKP